MSFSRFHPLVQQWFTTTLGAPTPAQARGWAAIAAGEHTLIELPVHWSLDDAPHFAHSTDPAALLAVWLSELRHARAEQRQLTLTLHPEILGRPHRLDCLTTILDELRATDTTTLTHTQAAARAGAADAGQFEATQP